MGWYEELTKALGTAGRQVQGQPIPKPKDIHFTNHFQAIAKARGLTEKDALDVYYHGSPVKQNMLKRHYNGYELGIYFFKDYLTGQAIITSIWKRERR